MDVLPYSAVPEGPLVVLIKGGINPANSHHRTPRFFHDLLFAIHIPKRKKGY